MGSRVRIGGPEERESLRVVMADLDARSGEFVCGLRNY